MNGVDHVEPHTAIPMLDRQAVVGRRPARDRIRRCRPTSTAVRRAVERDRPALETVTGELRTGTDYANLLPGVLSARVYLKQQNARYRRCSSRTPSRSRSSRRCVGARYPAGELRHAWKTLLQNHPHDSICGCSIDAVHEENMTRFARARQVGDAVVDAALDAIADTVPAPPPGVVRALVVNADAVERAQVVEAFIDLPIRQRGALAQRRRAGARSPGRRSGRARRRSTRSPARTASACEFQVLGEEQVVSHVMSRYETPWALNVRRLHVLWWAPALPPCGYAAFDLHIGIAGAAAPLKRRLTSRGGAYASATAGVSSRPANARRRTSGCVSSVNDDGTFRGDGQGDGRHLFSASASLEDVGDVGDEYNYCPPAADGRVTSADARVTEFRTRVCAGPLRASFRVDLELPLPCRGERAIAARRADRHRRRSRVDRGDARRRLAARRLRRHGRQPRAAITGCGCSFRPARARRARRAPTPHSTSSHVRRAVPVPAAVRNESPVSSAPMISVVDAGDDAVGATVIGRA